MTQPFIIVYLDRRSVVPQNVHTFATIEQAKRWVEEFTDDPTAQSEGELFWADWGRCQVFGYGQDGDIDEPIAAIYPTVQS